MAGSVRLHTMAQFEEAGVLVDLLSRRPDLPAAERDRLTALGADLKQTVREDRRRPAGTARVLGTPADAA